MRKISWDQPVINQKEIGYLGCITKEIKGVLYFPLQAKVEPEILMPHNSRQLYKQLKVISQESIKVKLQNSTKNS